MVEATFGSEELSAYAELTDQLAAAPCLYLHPDDTDGGRLRDGDQVIFPAGGEETGVYPPADRQDGAGPPDHPAPSSTGGDQCRLAGKDRPRPTEQVTENAVTDDISASQNNPDPDRGAAHRRLSGAGRTEAARPFPDPLRSQPGRTGRHLAAHRRRHQAARQGGHHPGRREPPGLFPGPGRGRPGAAADFRGGSPGPRSLHRRPEPCRW